MLHDATDLRLVPTRDAPLPGNRSHPHLCVQLQSPRQGRRVIEGPSRPTQHPGPVVGLGFTKPLGKATRNPSTVG